ncbi:MAG: chorismate-binding protein [Gammaproteobacteria bacterium]|nr:chorismate-binding protein [Gammaproteobacteria bacterium]MBU1723969.1 chorismate-binding protein [Gammaproteobacteria bacterium]MBU2007162.1 chorismate-binding protein [Gammaproteobacteria bacterium]
MKMLPEMPLLAWLRRRLVDEGVEEGVCNTPLREGLFSVTLVVPQGLCPLPVLRTDFPQPCFYWHRPEQQHRVVGLGEAARCVATGENRFAELKQQLAQLDGNWHKVGEAMPIAAMTGYAFDATDGDEASEWQGFPNALLTVPELVLEQREQRTTLTLTARLGGKAWQEVWVRWQELAVGLVAEPSGSYPSPQPRTQPLSASSLKGRGAKDEEPLAPPLPLRERGLGGEGFPPWSTLVNQAKATLHHGELRKLVVARSTCQPLTPGVDAALLMRRMQQHYRSCTLLAVSFGSGWLLAATPERLVSLRDGRVSCDALAGTIARKHGRANFPARMREAEHPPVVAAIRQALTKVCSEVSVGQQMLTLSLPHLQHLWTQVSGKALPNIHVLDLLECLHPTPAINGFPATPARQWLRTHGNHRRGWYSGGVGWLRHDGEGELSVLLRCALLHDGEAHLFAGAGIVADSDPQQEWDETELKLDTLRRLLDAGN